MAGIPAARVVAVFAKLDTGKTQVGSGYLLDARRVLTARHCTYDRVTGRPASALSITRASDGACAAATVSAASVALDVALLAVVDNPPWELKLPGGPVTFGRVDREHTGQLDDCEAVGYPLWQASEAGDYRDLAELHGYIYALEGRERQRLVLREPKLLGAGWARAAVAGPGGAAEAGGVASGQSAWNGLSGAAVFHDGLLLGVVIEHHPRQGSTAVQIRPVDAIVVASDEDAIHLRAALGLTGLDAIRPVGAASLDVLVAQVSPEGRLPAVGACDPFEAGVVRTSHDNAGTAPYVARDVDKAALEPALREHRLVVLLGPSAAGKSRTAMQAARTLLPGYFFLQPLPGVALRSAFGRFGDQQVLVWFDDLDRFIDGGPRGLTVGLLGEISVSRPGWKFLATLRTDRRETILAEDDERSRALRQVLGAGTVIGLGRSLSNEERVRAELAYPQEDFRGGVGLGERLIAGPELRDRLLGAANPLGAMLCRAAIDLQLIGLEPPFSRADLSALAPVYMQHEHPDVPADSFDFPAAFDWAMAPLVSHVSLLAVEGRSPESVRVADYVAADRGELKRKRWIPAQTWAWAISKAERVPLRKVAASANAANEWNACIAACTKALRTGKQDHHYFAWVLGSARYSLKDYPAAVHALTFAATSEDEVIRAHTLRILADAHYDQGQRDQAIECLERACTTRHAHTVSNAALRLAEIREEQIRHEHGDLVLVQAHYERAARVAAENSDPQTAGLAWRRIGQLRRQAGDPAGAARALVAQSQFAATDAIRDRLVLDAGHQFRDAARDVATARSCFIAVLERTGQPEFVAEAAFSIALLYRDQGTNGQADSLQVGFYCRLAVENGTGPAAQTAAICLAIMLPDDNEEKQTLLQTAASGPNPEDRAGAELTIAQLELRLGNADAAVPHLDAAFDGLRSTTNTTNLIALAETMELAGQADRAGVVYGIVQRVGNIDEQVRASLNKAKLLRADGQAAEAAGQLRQLAAEDALGAGRDDVALELAKALCDMDQWAEAISLLKETIGDRADVMPALWQQLALVHVREVQYEEAIECARHLIDSPDPADHAHGLWISARNHLALSHIDTAVRQFTAVIETGHRHVAASAHAHLSVILAGLGGNDEAVLAHCRAAMDMGDPLEAAQAAERLAWTLHRLDRTAEGTAALAEFAPKAGSEYRAGCLCLWAQFLYLESKFARARRVYEEGLAQAVAGRQESFVTKAADGLLAIIAPEDWTEHGKIYTVMRQHADRNARARAGFEHACIFSLNGQFTQARELLAEVIASDVQPYVVRAWVLIAEAMWQDGDPGSALAALAKSADSSDPWVLDNRPLIEGGVRLGLDDAEGAAECFQRVLSSENPVTVGHAQRLLGLTMSALSRDREAVEYLEQAIASEDHRVSHQARLDFAAHSAGSDPEKAIASYQSLAADPIGCMHIGSAALRAGALLVDQGRKDEARPLLRQALLAPQQPVAREAVLILSGIDADAGDTETARRRLAGLAETPDEPFGLHAVFSLAQLDSGDGFFEAALDKYTFVRDRCEPNSSGLAYGELGAAEALTNLGRHDEAYPALLDLCDSELQDVRAMAHLLLGHVYRHRGDLNAAGREYQAAVKAAGPDDSVATRAQEALNALTE